MATIIKTPVASGAPGIAPRWTRSAKDAIGTAYSSVSRIWFTASAGVLNEIYFPTIDQPQIRDLQFLITDGETFFHEERRNLSATTEYLNEHGLGIRVVSHSPDGRYHLIKEIITDPHQPTLLINTRIEGDPELLKKLHLYVLLAPHLGVAGWGNNGNLTRIIGHEFLTAHKEGIWLAMAATTPFVRSSIGYVGSTDGWQDLNSNFKMDFEFAAAEEGNIAMMGEIDLRRGYSFTLGVAFGRELNRAVTTLHQSLCEPFAEHRTRFIEQWNRACLHFHPLEQWSGDNGALYHRSRELLLAHEDKTYPGALIASLSIPWGEAKGDEDLGGYHLVWTRDMVNSVTGLLASGDTATALRALIYLACAQRADGGFPQNFWIDGQPYWNGIQLDEVSFPITLAWRLHVHHGLKDFDPYPMVRAAAFFLIKNGVATPQERWEENAGYSPSTLAANITALICAACFARQRGDLVSAQFLEEYADFLEANVERWTVTDEGFLVPGIKRHYVRINPVDTSNPDADESLAGKLTPIRNRPPGERYEFPAAEIVDGGFLELVRYGIRKAGDPLMEDSLRVLDAALKTDFPAGPCWRRYTHDGYGQQDDGGPFIGSGRGRPWPLLTGERGHYELAAGRDPMPYLRAMERFANATQLLPEQIWDQPDIPRALLKYGAQTGSATPLMWAHAEYIKLLRSTADKQVFDLIPEVAERYANRPHRPSRLQVWKTNRHARRVARGGRLRILADEGFVLHWSKNEWRDVEDTIATPTPLGFYYVDIDALEDDKAPIRFTFKWRDSGAWEGRDYAVAIED
ncbi:MAG: glycoside hydrolase family 15 protein [Candidatus Binatus sp.]|uniref:glycoside hydrolase family 15 protein n=1 Tax=Candidatus Binatus sp. TaxID=2811406 RepID=UPI002716979E|nr:glycoside hydrolase family 15 protein [Candidatus Binatus sp.]MDO8433066.1 glycoside hydrolase family 15 protein [Candidatus Binatus sp.]